MNPQLGAPTIHDKPNRNMRLRATDEEWADFMSMLKGNTRERFIQIRKALLAEHYADINHMIGAINDYLDGEYTVDAEDLFKELGI